VSRLNDKIIEWLSAEAIELGFLECAPVSLKRDPNFNSYLDWVDNGHHKPLAYLEKNLDKRENPSLLGDKLKSAIVFLHPYPKEFNSKYVAKYACGRDYHKSIKEKMFQLSDTFSKQWGQIEEQKICVDTVPILERSLAQQSKMGWIGKNGCFISRKHGSFTLLSVWLLSYEYDEPLSEINSFHCGKCTRCIEACPTDAFLEPGKINTSKCISTLTIENRHTIDKKYFNKILSSAFGCDICQDVCPWNKKHLSTDDEEYLPDLKTLLSLDEKEFRDYFRKTPLDRPGWTGLKRNFLILASNDPNVPDSIFKNYSSHSNELLSITAKNILELRNEQI
jgi:epoxyqueuosine reductase